MKQEITKQKQGFFSAKVETLSKHAELTTQKI